jgi:hypothetical protein
MRCEKVSVEGKMHLHDAHIGGLLVLHDAGPAAEGFALDLRDATLDDGVMLTDARLSDLCVRGTTFKGLVQAPRMTVNNARGLKLEGARFEAATIVSFDTSLDLEGIVARGAVILFPACSGSATLDSLSGAMLEAPLVVPDRVSLRNCTLTAAIGLNNLQIRAADPDWPKWRRRRILPDERTVRQSSAQAKVTRARAVEGSYRELRAALEDAKAAPAAADFYYGEMEMRRLAAPKLSIERTLLLFYKVLSGYGLRAWRALASYAVTLLAASAALRWPTNTFILDQHAAAGIPAGTKDLPFHHFGDVVAFVARSSLSFLSIPIPGLTAWGTALLLITRFAALVFLTLTVLAIRARVHR